MAEQFDVIVLGMGPGGEVATGILLKAAKKVAVIERELIGGECAYWACIPSKILLRPPEAKAETTRAVGVPGAILHWPAVAAYRDEMIRHLDDAQSVESYTKQGATVFKGAGKLAGRGIVLVNGTTLRAKDIIIATGSDTQIPKIDGLGDVPYWTNREATTMREVPKHVALVGGGPVAIELGQMMARFGAQVTLVQSADRLIDREDPQVGALIRAALVDEGIDVHLGRKATAVRRAGEKTIITLDDGTEIETDALVLAAGRSPRVAAIGLETVGVTPGEKGIAVDDHCRVADGLWAVGDVTGEALLTHVAQYQGRVAAANILGTPATADYRAIPRVVFSDPEIAAVGMTEEQAKKAGLTVKTATVDLAKEITRPATYERNTRGTLGLIADTERSVLVGAWAVAPLAGEWLQIASVAIKAAIPLATLHDTIVQFPTFAEALWYGVDKMI